MNKEKLTRINGKLYDLSDFKHPGGPISKKFAANRDATLLFESHHPFSKEEVNKLLKKYEVKDDGSVKDDTCEFFDEEKHTEFEKDLIKEVHSYFKEVARKKNISISSAIKATGKRWTEIFIFNILFAITLYMWFSGYWSSLVLLPVFGWISGVNTFHDASHFTLSKKWYINSLFSYAAPMISSPFDWYHQHVIGHHMYTNVGHRDPDIAHAYFFYRSHNSVKWLITHIGQQYHFINTWAFALVGVQVINPAIGIVSKKYNRSVHYMPVSAPRWTIHVAGRIAAIMLMYGWMWFVFEWHQALMWLLVPNIILSLLFMLNTQINHLFVNTAYAKDKDWYKHQATGSNNFGIRGWKRWIYFYLSGGLNFHIEHHLFPTVNHCHYLHLQPIIENICAKHNVTYNVSGGYTRSFVKYWKYIKLMSHKNAIIPVEPGQKHAGISSD